RARYFRQEYGLAERYLQQLLDEYPWIDYGNEARVWLAKVHAEMGAMEAMENDLEPILSSDSPPRDLLTEIYMLRGDLALRNQGPNLAMRHFEAAAGVAVNPTQRANIYYRLYSIALDQEELDQAADYLGRFSRVTPSEKDRVQSRLEHVKLLQKMNDIDGALRQVRSMQQLKEYSDILPGLRLEIGKIEARLGNVEAALETYLAILEEYRTTPEASEASFHAGEIYLAKQHDPKAAQEEFKKVANQTFYFQPARLKLEQIRKLETLDDVIAGLTDDLQALELAADEDTTTAVEVKADSSVAAPMVTAIQDSVQLIRDRLAILEKLAHAKFRLAELQLIELHNVEPALVMMAEIAYNYEQTAIAPQAAYVIYYHATGDSSQEEFWRNYLLERYPGTPYALLFSSGEDRPATTRLDSLLNKAVALLDDAPDKSLEIYSTIRREFGTEQSSFAIAYLYDEYIADLDNAIAAYEEYQKYFPDGEYTRISVKRLQELKEIKLSVADQLDKVDESTDESQDQ
ncbi:MAG: tetratricopeptide repeat protein, partial [Candidatus Marinimicrobia bacterium]|nr:tetratricopeptide repeat protein [Candidatus Neomarinimicrobiota bacterium]